MSAHENLRALARAACLAVVVVAGCSRAGSSSAGSNRRESGSTQPYAPIANAPSHAQVDAPAAAPSAAYPVRWSTQLGLKSLTEIGARIDATDPLGFGTLARGGKEATPTSCQQWFELHAAGYAPATAMEEQPDGGARLRCGALSLLKRAVPARMGFVRDVRFDDPEVVKLLPAEVGTAESDAQVARVKAFARAGKSFAALAPKAHVAGTDEGWTTIEEGNGQSSVRIRPEAWGDFNGDGLDDVALSVVNSMTHGSVARMRLLVLTRSSGNEPLRVVEALADEGSGDQPPR